MAAPKYLRAVSGFMTADGVIVKAGQTVAADDKIVKGRAELFEPLDDHIETATRAPGERRITLGRPARDVVVMSAGRTRRSRARQDKVKQEQDETAARLKAEQEEAARQAAEAAAGQGTGDGGQAQGGDGTGDGGSGG